MCVSVCVRMLLLFPSSSSLPTTSTSTTTTFIVAFRIAYRITSHRIIYKLQKSWRNILSTRQINDLLWFITTHLFYMRTPKNESEASVAAAKFSSFHTLNMTYWRLFENFLKDSANSFHSFFLSFVLSFLRFFSCFLYCIHSFFLTEKRLLLTIKTTNKIRSTHSLKWNKHFYELRFI